MWLQTRNPLDQGCAGSGWCLNAASAGNIAAQSGDENRPVTNGVLELEYQPFQGTTEWKEHLLFSDHDSRDGEMPLARSLSDRGQLPTTRRMKSKWKFPCQDIMNVIVGSDRAR